jgi:20S proteasome alpha/beta subunit
MTCAVGIETDNTVIIGADSAWGTDDFVSPANSPKAFRMGEFVSGFAGSWRLGLAIHHRFAPPAIGKDARNLDYYMNSRFVEALRDLLATNEVQFPEGSQIIVGIRGELYEIDREFGAVRSPGYLAIGAGEMVATGSLHTTEFLDIEPWERLRLALEAAAAHIPGVCPPFVYAENTPAKLTVVRGK